MKIEELQRKCLIRVVDDDKDLQRAITFLLECAGWRSVAYDSAREFLTADSPSTPGCLILDVKMPGMTGIELQHEMSRRKLSLPIIFLSGHGDIEMAVEAIQAGAVHFLTKPVNKDRLLEVLIKATCKSVQESPLLDDKAQVIQQRTSLLTSREKEILELVSHNLSNRAIGERCGISERTVEAHRFSISKKLQMTLTPSLAHLIVRGSH